MDPALNLYLELNVEKGVDIWGAANGMIVTGHTVGLTEYFAAAMKMDGHGHALEKFSQSIQEYEQILLHPSKPDKDPSLMILFTDATVYLPDRQNPFHAIVGVDPDNVFIWGPGILEISAIAS